MDDAPRPEYSKESPPEWAAQENIVGGVVTSAVTMPELIDDAHGDGRRRWQPPDVQRLREECGGGEMVIGDAGQVHKQGLIRLAGRLYGDGSCTQNMFK